MGAAGEFTGSHPTATLAKHSNGGESKPLWCIGIRRWMNPFVVFWWQLLARWLCPLRKCNQQELVCECSKRAVESMANSLMLVLQANEL